MTLFFGRWIDSFMERWAGLRPGLRWLLILVTLATGGILLARPASWFFKEFAAERNLRGAQEAMLNQQPAEARAKAMATLQWKSEQPDAVRVLMWACDTLSDPMRGQSAWFLLRREGAPPADKLAAFQILARTSPLAMAGHAWTMLSDAERQDPVFIMAFGRRLIDEGKPSETASLLRGIDLNAPPTLLRELVFETFVSAASQPGWLEAQALLARVANDEVGAGRPVPAWCLDAWDRVPTEFLEPRHASSLNATKTRRSEIIRRRMMLNRQALSLGEPELQNWLREPDAGSRMSLVHLLTGAGLTEVATTMLESQKRPTMPEYLWLRDQRAARNEWQALWDWMNRTDLSEISQVLSKGDAAMILARMGKTQESSQAWSDALRLGASCPRGVSRIHLSRHVRRWDAKLANDALLISIREQEEFLPLFADTSLLTRQLIEEKREHDLLAVLRRYTQLEPQNPNLLIRHAYLALLVGELHPDKALEIAKVVSGAMPSSPHPRVVAILACLLKDQRPQACEWINSPQTDWSPTPPFYRWLVETSRLPPPAAAPPPAPESLLPSELALMQKWSGATGKKKHPVSSSPR